MMLKVFPRLLLAHWGIIFGALVRGQIVAVIKGLFMSGVLSVVKMFERHKIQKQKTVSLDYINSIIIHDLPSNARKLRKLRSLFLR